MLNEKINEMIKTSMLSGNKVESEVYKLIKNEFLKFKTAKNAKPLDDAAEIAILQKMVKQREESVKAYIDGNRPELAAAEQSEIDVISKLLPAIPTKEDVESYLNENYPNGIEKKSMGLVIKTVKEHLIGVDGKMLADIVKTRLV
jgi:uncharacterized protein YqeY